MSVSRTSRAWPKLLPLSICRDVRRIFGPKTCSLGCFSFLTSLFQSPSIYHAAPMDCAMNSPRTFWWIHLDMFTLHNSLTIIWCSYYEINFVKNSPTLRKIIGQNLVSKSMMQKYKQEFPEHKMGNVIRGDCMVVQEETTSWNQPYPPRYMCDSQYLNCETKPSLFQPIFADLASLFRQASPSF